MQGATGGRGVAAPESGWWSAPVGLVRPARAVRWVRVGVAAVSRGGGGGCWGGAMSRPVSVWKVSPSAWVGSPVRVNSPRWCPSWWKVHRARRLVVSVGPPSRQWVRWWISRWRVQPQPGKRQPRSRSRTRMRVRCGTTRWARPTLTGCPSVSQTGVRVPSQVSWFVMCWGRRGRPVSQPPSVSRWTCTRYRARRAAPPAPSLPAASRERVASTMRASAQVTRGRPPSTSVQVGCSTSPLSSCRSGSTPSGDPSVLRVWKRWSLASARAASTRAPTSAGAS